MRENLPKKNGKEKNSKARPPQTLRCADEDWWPCGGGAEERGSAYSCEHEGARGVAAMEIGDPRVASVREGGGGAAAAEAVARVRRFAGDDDAGGVDVGAGRGGAAGAGPGEHRALALAAGVSPARVPPRAHARRPPPDQPRLLSPERRASRHRVRAVSFLPLEERGALAVGQGRRRAPGHRLRGLPLQPPPQPLPLPRPQRRPRRPPLRRSHRIRRRPHIVST
jgi:hypothetical protein